MKIENGNIVRIEFELRIKDGEVLESSANSGPVEYVQGEGKLLPALESRLLGLVVGASAHGEIPSAEVSPPEDSLPTRTIPRSELPKDATFDVGMMLNAKMPGAGTVDLRIVSVDDKQLVARILPPFAGKDLAFKVRVIRIEDPNTHAFAAVPPPLPVDAAKIVVDQESEEPSSIVGGSRSEGLAVRNTRRQTRSQRAVTVREVGSRFAVSTRQGERAFPQVGLRPRCRFAPHFVGAN